MSFNLRGRSLLRELDFTPQEFTFLIDLAAELKAAKYAGESRLRTIKAVMVATLGA